MDRTDIPCSSSWTLSLLEPISVEGLGGLSEYLVLVLAIWSVSSSDKDRGRVNEGFSAAYSISETSESTINLRGQRQDIVLDKRVGEKDSEAGSKGTDRHTEEKVKGMKLITEESKLGS